jgi:hypothetical protein
MFIEYNNIYNADQYKLLIYNNRLHSCQNLTTWMKKKKKKLWQMKINWSGQVVFRQQMFTIDNTHVKFLLHKWKESKKLRGLEFFQIFSWPGKGSKVALKSGPIWLSFHSCDKNLMWVLCVICKNILNIYFF